MATGGTRPHWRSGATGAPRPSHGPARGKRGYRSRRSPRAAPRAGGLEPYTELLRPISPRSRPAERGPCTGGQPGACDCVQRPSAAKAGGSRRSSRRARRSSSGVEVGPAGARMSPPERGNSSVCFPARAHHFRADERSDTARVGSGYPLVSTWRRRAPPRPHSIPTPMLLLEARSRLL
jgi:hypothetical protein